MVILRILDLPLEDGVTHEATDWQVSDQPSFATKTLESLGDTRNINTIIFNEVLDPNIKWCARARARLSTGYTIWGNLDIFLPENDNVIDASEDLPSRVSIPQISTNSDPKDHDVSMFTISANGFETLGNGTLSATTWIIEDINGKVVWSSVYNTTDKTTIDITNLILKSNMVYRIKVMFHSTSQDASPFGCLIIKTADNDEINLNTYLDWVDIGDPITLVSNKIEGVTSTTWSIIFVNQNYSEVLWTTTTRTPNEHTVDMPTSILTDDKLYILKIDPDKEGIGSKFIPFRTKWTGATVETPPELIVPEDETTEEVLGLDPLTNHPFIVNLKTAFRDSSLLGSDIMALPDIENFPISVVRGTNTDFTEYPQDMIGDFFTNKLNNRDNTKILTEVAKKDIKNYLKDNSIPYFIINNYKEIDKPVILPMNDVTGGTLIKDLAPYVPVESLQGKDRLAQVILDADNNIVNLYYKIGSDYTIKNGLVATQIDTNTFGYVFVLTDGSDINGIEDKKVFGPTLENGNYKLVLVDLVESKKHVIPFSINGTASRSNGSEKIIKWIQESGNKKTLVDSINLTLQAGGSAILPYMIVNHKLPTVQGDIPVGVNVTSMAVDTLLGQYQEGQEDLIEQYRQELALQGLTSKDYINTGKLTITVDADIEAGNKVLTYVTEDGTTLTLNITIPDSGTEEQEES